MESVIINSGKQQNECYVCVNRGSIESNKALNTSALACLTKQQI